MPTTTWDRATRAKLYVRADLPTPAEERRQTVQSRLEDLVASEVFEDAQVTSWAKRVPVDETDDVGRFERSLYAEFADWAAREGVRLSPFFGTRECYSSVTGTRRTELVMPAMCLALYDEDDELVSVVPHATETDTVDVCECLRSFETTRERATRAGTAD